MAICSSKAEVPRNFFLMDKLCLRITVNTTDIIEELTSNQEEADTKLLLHAKHAFNSTENQAVLVRSPSGDMDINVLFIALFPEKADRVYLDYGTGKSRKILKLSLVDIPDNLRAALVRFHAFTINDYVSAIFRKSKRVCWKLIEKSRKFADMFARLGEEWIIDADLMRLLEEYVCSLFSKGKKHLNMLRYEIFKKHV